MSESPQNQQPTDKPGKGGKPPRVPSNPFEGSALLSSAPPLPELSVPPQAAARGKPAASEKELLYKRKPSPEFMMRPFDRRHDRQTVYIDALKVGAFEALITLVARGNKTDLVDEMVADLLKKYGTLLEENEEFVEKVEEKYREKHNL